MLASFVERARSREGLSATRLDLALRMDGGLAGRGGGSIDRSVALYGTLPYVEVLTVSNM